MGYSHQPETPPAGPKTKGEIDADLVDLARHLHNDPLGFVMAAYPWGVAGTMLEHHEGPDVWQTKFLKELGAELRANAFDGHTPVMPVLRAVSKGHGVGGSVMIAWLVQFIMVTRPHSQGTVTANTVNQLTTKTWATIRRWNRLSLFGHWWTINTERMYHPAFPESWYCAAATCRAENSEAFAGQHAADSTSFYMFDEDSNIPDIIHEVAEGGMTDGEPMMFRFGNATRNSGGFHRACFGAGRDRWHATIVDSRTSRFSNKALIESWVEEHGEDSDFIRVRVRGLPPRGSDLQFIPTDLVWAAQKRVVTTFDDEPLVVGVDFSGGGKAWNIARFRRGLDAKSIPAVRVSGEATRNDRSAFLAILAGILSDRSPGKRVAMMFCDMAYGAAYVERLRSMGFSNVLEVAFGEGHSPDEKHCANMRAYMHKRMKEWLAAGAIPDDPRLEADLTAYGHHTDNKDRLVIESKKSMADRGVTNIDENDSLVLTFAMPVGPTKTGRSRSKVVGGRFSGRQQRSSGGFGWTH